MGGDRAVHASKLARPRARGRSARAGRGRTRTVQPRILGREQGPLGHAVGPLRAPRLPSPCRRTLRPLGLRPPPRWGAATPPGTLRTRRRRLARRAVPGLDGSPGRPRCPSRGRRPRVGKTSANPTRLQLSWSASGTPRHFRPNGPLRRPEEGPCHGPASHPRSIGRHRSGRSSGPVVPSPRRSRRRANPAASCSNLLTGCAGDQFASGCLV